MKQILVVSKNPELLASLRTIYPTGFQILTASSVMEGLDLFRQYRCDVIFIELRILQYFSQASSSDYGAALQPFRAQSPNVDIVVITSQELLREAVTAVRQGASAYIMFPIIAEELRLVFSTLRDSQIVQSERNYLRDQFWDQDAAPFVKTQCQRMSKVFEDVRSVAPTKSTVLLTGETGTGKGVLAKLIHRHSNRRNEQFIHVHCGAIPDTLLESELFGHEKGAFTGAVKRRMGKFEIAHGGTIFLDEIGTITPAAQIKLLQVLQDGVLQRVGSEQDTRVDVRVIAATNESLDRLCEEKKFRKDLYYRLNVFPINLPPLRERKEDISGLAQTFIQQFNRYHVKDIRDIHPQVIEAFLRYSWPGNIRELENIIERACILERSSVLLPESFPAELFAVEENLSRVQMDTMLTLSEVRRRGLEEIERCYLKGVLEMHRGVINKSAEAAGVTTRQFHKLMKKYGLRKEEFKK
ncbi:sigma-54 dependent transcriptional regulator [Desulfogranum japonicum]|uniref:sigma-54 dependent transcriptional regulator n=1 Tax=Desulfogranum japonicum TaxID=231447 RepID=UPI00041C2728|nr:sigma-54 dependent transcriptional regulator [Desulfogranum japonicum]